jgi:signal transduction histidine kinase
MAKADANVKEGELMWVVKVNLPLDSTRKDLAKNNAILLATAIGTAFLAMLAAYAIVRYVIVKPVLHLKDVSDQVARGNLELRADIRTGDEFEELSHTFNRMLRHLVTVQDELRAVNTDLDGKVDQLAQVNLRLYEMNKLKDDFLATMSHELRTPLNSILGFSDILARSENLTEKQKRFVRNIQTSGNALMVMINDLLDLAKIESGRVEIQVVECSLADLVERQIGLLNPLADKRNINLSYEIDPTIPPLLQDSVKIQQILNNLLSNAIKFTPEGGRVRVRARRVDDDWFESEVEDTGIGIPLDEQATIFEKFRQGHTLPGQTAVTREYGGTGLGLSIVKELSKLLGGEVSLVSEFGKGSTFSVRLPIRLEERASGHGEQPSASNVGLNRATHKLLGGESYSSEPSPSGDGATTSAAVKTRSDETAA